MAAAADTDKVATAYRSIPATDRLSNLAHMPLPSLSLITGLRNFNMDAVVLTGNDKSDLFKTSYTHLPAMKMATITVGYFNNTYPGYRKVTAAEWTNPIFQSKLVEAHQENGGGWPFLEEPFQCSDVLYVAEGCVLIDNQPIFEVRQTGYEPYEQLRGLYSANNSWIDVPWTTMAPDTSWSWSVMMRNPHENPPCLFIKDFSAATPEGGSRRSRRHKRSKRIRKQKKRTQKH